MACFLSLLEELQGLESRLKTAANRLWMIKLALTHSRVEGHSDLDFLPRRLGLLERQEERRFEEILGRLNRLIVEHLDSSLIVFNSLEDVATVASIRKTIRSLQNAFANEPAVGSAWARLNAALPAFSIN